MKMTDTSVNKTIENISIIRCAACFFVMFGHTLQFIGVQGGMIPDLINDYCNTGPYVFFVISGYLAFNSYELKSGNTIKYYIKRAFRILPCYYLVIIGWVILYESGYKGLAMPPDSSGLYWLRYFFVLHMVVPTENGQWSNLGSTWTIGCFVLFYLLVPILFRIIRGWKSAFVFLILMLLISHGGDDLFWHLLMLSFPYFALGIILYYCYDDQKKLNNIMFISASVVMTLFFMDYNTRFISMALIAIIMCASKSWQIKDLRVKKIVQIFDKHTYAIYLIHPFVGKIISIPVNDGLINRYFAAVLIVICTFIMSYVEYDLFEEKVIRKRILCKMAQ